MDKLIKKLTAEPLSGQDMLNATDNETKVLSYSELANVDDIFDILEPYNNFTLLYELRPNYGHWVCVIYHPETHTIEFFDPYGMFIDDQFKYIKDKNISHEKLLSKLLLKTDANIIYNDKPLQKFSKDISSCGRWTAFRINLRDIPLEDFQTMMMSKSKNERDKLITTLTAFI